MTNLTRRSVVSAAPAAVVATSLPLVAASFAAREVHGKVDLVLSQIAQHKALRDRANTMPGDDEDPAFLAAVDDEEAALQALGDLVPTSVEGAAALLKHMAEMEGCFATGGSPLLRTVLSVAKALEDLHRRTAP